MRLELLVVFPARCWTPRCLGQLAAQLRDLAAQAIDHFRLANLRAILWRGEVGTFSLEAAEDTSMAGDRAVALADD